MEEIYQETFLRAMNSIERYDYSCKISVWLCQIAKPPIPEQETDADPQHCQYHCNPFALWRPLYFLAFPFILLYNGERGPKTKFSKYFFYIFYTIHIWVIYIIDFIVTI